MNSVIKGASYVLVQTPDMVIHNGATQVVEREANPDSEYLKKLPTLLRSYEDCVNYAPNQTYIGNITPDELSAMPQPWTDVKCEGKRYGKYGEIMPQDEFYLMMQVSGVFDLVLLDKDFVAATKDKLAADPVIGEDVLARIKEGFDMAEIEKVVNEEHGEGLYMDGKLVGAVKKAHDVDPNLSAHVIHEDLVYKASAVLSLLWLVKASGVDPNSIEYIIDCGEEACGDINQRGGGNFAKAAAEIAGFKGTTGSDTRGFCAGPAHSMVNAASLVKAGTYKNVVVLAGGCTAKLGMNGKNFVAKELPILEDVLGGFAILLSENDGVNPEVLTDFVGRHTVGAGAGPKDVINALVSAPLDKAGMKITDIDKYSAEMQNPDVMIPAGAGDVALSNYKVIGALAVMRGEIAKTDLPGFPAKYGMCGWAPTQGHIPSGVPYVGPARDSILASDINKAMIVGKGSLFLGRMTNLFDGISFIMQANSGAADEGTVSEAEIKSLIGKAMREFAENLLAGAEEN